MKKRVESLTPHEGDLFRDHSFTMRRELHEKWADDFDYPLFPIGIMDTTRWDDSWIKHIDYPKIALELILEGCIEYHLDGETFSASAGEMFVIVPHSNVRIVNAHAGSARRKLVLIIGGGSPGASALLLGFERDTLLKLADPGAVEKEMRAIGKIISGSGSHLKAAAAVYELLLRLSQEKCSGVSRVSGDMLMVRRYMLENFSGDVKISSLAGLAGMSPATLRRKFSAVFGMSPLKYLNTIRLERAAGLLQTSALPVKEIGFLCGFNSALYFGEAFRNFFGCTPGSFRQKKQQ